jgi:hypothetical protein
MKPSGFGPFALDERRDSSCLAPSSLVFFTPWLRWPYILSPVKPSDSSIAPSPLKFFVFILRKQKDFFLEEDNLNLKASALTGDKQTCTTN